MTLRMAELTKHETGHLAVSALDKGSRGTESKSRLQQPARALYVKQKRVKTGKNHVHSTLNSMTV